MINGGKQASKDEDDYTVKEGDTLGKIVKDHYPDASREELREKITETAENSGIKNPDIIHPGQKIVFDDNKGNESESAPVLKEPSQSQTDSSSTTSHEEYENEADYDYVNFSSQFRS